MDRLDTVDDAIRSAIEILKEKHCGGCTVGVVIRKLEEMGCEPNQQPKSNKSNQPNQPKSKQPKQVVNGYKVCTKCNISKPILEFSANKTVCKLCTSEYAKEWYRRNLLKSATKSKPNTKFGTKPSPKPSPKSSPKPSSKPSSSSLLSDIERDTKALKDPKMEAQLSGR